MTKLRAYYDLLARQDWYYNFSDDQDRWREGEKRYHDLAEISTESEKHKKLWDDFLAFYSLYKNDEKHPPRRPGEEE